MQSVSQVLLKISTLKMRVVTTVELFLSVLKRSCYEVYHLTSIVLAEQIRNTAIAAYRPGQN